MKGIRFRILGILLAVMMVMLVPTAAFAATTQDVTVTATPSFVSISNTPTSYGFGTIATSTNYTTAQGYFTVTNGSSVPINVSIAVTGSNWTGGIGWIHSDTATQAADQVGLVASNNTNSLNIAVKSAAPVNITGPWSGNFQWELRLLSPTEFNDGTQKTNTVRLTASAS